MIPHFPELPSIHFLNWAGLSGINYNPRLKRAGGVGVVGGIKAERIKAARAKEEDPTKQEEEFGTPEFLNCCSIICNCLRAFYAPVPPSCTRPPGGAAATRLCSLGEGPL